MTYFRDMDVLRFYAASVVALEHWSEFLGFDGPDLAKYGVYLFFTISGFLITSILLSYREKYKSGRYFGLFYLRRIFRIVPIYYLYITLFVVLGQFGYFYCKDVDFTFYYLYLSNFHILMNGMDCVVLNHSWSLAVEEQFYLLWPLVLMVIPRKRLQAFLLLSLGLLIILKNTIFLQIHPPFLNPFFNFDFIIVGAFLALNQLTIRKFVDAISPWPWIPIIVFIIALSLKQIPSVVPVDFVFLIVCFFLVQYSISGFKKSVISKIFANELFVTIGKWSYGFYLYHKGVPYLLKPILTRFDISFSPYLMFFLFLLITLTISYISFNTVEWYFTGVKNRLSSRINARHV